MFLSSGLACDRSGLRLRKKAIEFLMHSYMEHIERLSMTGGVKVVLVGFQRFFTPPFHVLYQLLKAALDFSLSLRRFIDVANCLGNVPMTRLVHIGINLSGFAGRIPTVFAIRLCRKCCALHTQKEWDSAKLSLPLFRLLKILLKRVALRIEGSPFSVEIPTEELGCFIGKAQEFDTFAVA